MANQTIDLYFSLLGLQINKFIQEQNKLNNDTLLIIIKEHYKLGKCTEDEVLQLEVNNLNIELQLQQLNDNKSDKENELKDFLRIIENENLVLVEPDLISLGIIEIEKAYNKALENSSFEIRQKEQMLKVQSDLARTKSEDNISFSLYATLGLSKSDADIKQSYKNPLNKEVVSLNFSIPIVDFGVRKNKIKQAQIRIDDTSLTLEQEKLNLKRDITNTVNKINALTNKIRLVQKTNELSFKRYEIAKTRYINGKIGFLEYSSAEYERDNSKMDYIEILKNIWSLYYELRQKTLYDFKNNREIDTSIF